MSDVVTEDYYETLQISPNAEPETIHRVFRILAQRFHPDNLETGSADRFRVIHEAYLILSDPVQRAQYDIVHRQTRDNRWRIEPALPDGDNDFELEYQTRLALLEVLYKRRRRIANDGGLYVVDFEQLLGRPREHLEFTTWFLLQKGLLKRTDDSRMTITADGCEYVEKHYRGVQQKRLLEAVKSL